MSYTRSGSYSTSASDIVCGRHFRTVTLIFIPIALSAMFLVAGADMIGVWQLIEGGQTYHLAAEGYNVDGNDVKLGFAYAGLDVWPESIRSYPLPLLFHLILGIIIAIYVLVMFFSCAREQSNYKLDPVLYPRVWLMLYALVMAILSLAVSCFDAAFWARGAAVADFNVEIAGGFLVVCGILFSTSWFFLLRPWAYAKSTTTSSSHDYYGSSSRSRGHGDSARSGKYYSSGSGSRSGGRSGTSSSRSRSHQ